MFSYGLPVPWRGWKRVRTGAPYPLLAAFSEARTHLKTEAGAGRWCSCLGLDDLVHGVDGLACRVFDVCGPHLLDIGNDGVRHGDVIQFIGHFVAILVSPGEELEGLAGVCGSLRLLVNEDPGGRGHRPGIVASLIGQDHAEARYG